MERSKPVGIRIDDGKRQVVNVVTWEQRKLSEVAEFNPKSELPETFEYVDLESVVGTEMVFP